MRVLLVDDEPLALRRLEILLERIGGLDVIDVCRAGDEAMDAIAKLKPDIVFLDVRMPVFDGFDVAETVDQKDGPAVVFITAHDDYAVRAFDKRAVDYLLKPVDQTRLAEAVDRARDAIAARAAGARVAELEAALAAPGDGDDAASKARDFWVKDRDRVVRVAESEIEWIEAERDYVRLHVNGRSWLVRDTMQRMEHALDPERFVRVHRSAIVNADAIRQARQTSSGGRVLRLASGAEVRVGRSYESVVSRMVTGRRN